eukprot:TRINITY_DN1180_c0_g1_i2.p2 TRINITY_DN1180_c0_g1~~TRINITY_DN1180_c0_g1_i2.p2  ORF type:complete len:150 (+),score=17.57 TRINITY_DN1180_c0_g1_i2:495-944(+)
MRHCELALCLLPQLTQGWNFAKNFAHTASRALLASHASAALLSSLCSNNFCVKEIMGMNAIAKANCGRTKYFGDTYNQKSGKCELRKCAAACEESAWSYEFEGITYQRQRFCCNYEFCNAGGQTRPNTAVLGILVPVAMALAYALATVL